MAVVEDNSNNTSQNSNLGSPFNNICIRNTNIRLPSLPQIPNPKIQDPLPEPQKPQLYYELKQLFLKNDASRDGRLSKKELSKAFATLGSRFPAYRAWLARIEADLDHDGYISWDEFDALISYTMKWLDSKF
ncbi:hypothetical protein SLEP1_g19643 [Rubroshorea leprosula]|uniref:EF-hand domain-containing protein n=1 Tax=Rubroshorea leprosula TaxID=152421 RepID=A0AAV5J3G2_9ROSI|nr:hypothetical protein SLEP1_g19643 [Rubroshorea leprosula]